METVRHGAARHETASDFAVQLHDALLQLVEGTPITRLERRLSDVEEWVHRLEEDAGRLSADLSSTPGAPHRRTATAKPSPAGITVPGRRIHHLPVEAEMARPGG